MEGIIILAILVGIVTLAIGFYVDHRDSEGFVGLLANLVGFVYHKFWIILIIGFLLAYFLLAIFS